jgi:hypothetical protein
VVNADHYVGAVWTDSIVDADKIFNSFPKYCYEGCSRCALCKEGDTKEDISERFYAVFENLKESPVTFISTFTGSPSILRYDDLKRLAFSVLYDPNHFGCYLLAQFMDAIVRGDVKAMSSFFFNEPSREIFFTDLPEWVYPTDAQLGILCSDKRYLVRIATKISIPLLTSSSSMILFRNSSIDSRRWPNSRYLVTSG